jgi:hypothetical protein
VGPKPAMNMKKMSLHGLKKPSDFTKYLYRPVFKGYVDEKFIEIKRKMGNI